MANNIATILLVSSLVATSAGCGEIGTSCRNEMCVAVRVSEPDGEIAAQIDPYSESTFYHQCRSSDLRFEAKNPDGEWVEAALNEFGDIVCRDSVCFFVDNRKHETATIQIGSIAFEVASNQHGKYRFPAPFGRVDVLMNGERIAEWEGGQNYLLDTTGSRRYVWEEVVYGDYQHSSPGESVSFSGGMLYEVNDDVDFFLEEIPDSIDVSYYSETMDMVGGYRRRYLTERE